MAVHEEMVAETCTSRQKRLLLNLRVKQKPRPKAFVRQSYEFSVRVAILRLLRVAMLCKTIKKFPSTRTTSNAADARRRVSESSPLSATMVILTRYATTLFAEHAGMKELDFALVILIWAPWILLAGRLLVGATRTRRSL